MESKIYWFSSIFTEVHGLGNTEGDERNKFSSQNNDEVKHIKSRKIRFIDINAQTFINEKTKSPSFKLAPWPYLYSRTALNVLF